MLRKFSTIVKLMKSESEEKRIRGRKLLRNLSVQNMTYDDLIFLVRSSADVHQDGYVKRNDCSSIIADYVAEYPSTSYIEEIYRAFKKSSSWAKSTYLSLLTTIGTEEALETFKKLIEMNLGEINDFVIRISPTDVEASEILFPAVFEYSNDEKLTYTMNCYIIDNLNYGTIDQNYLEEYIDVYLLKYKKIKEAFDTYEKKEKLKKEEKEEFKDIRNMLGTTLDVLSYVAHLDEIKEIFKSNVVVKDLEVKFIAVKTCIENKIDFHYQEVQKLCKADLTRGRMYNYLEYNDLLPLFPLEEANQEKLARSEVVFWLSSSTELGEEPREIELWKRIKRYDEHQGEVFYYLYKFKSDETHYEDDWMIAMTGHYLEQHLSATPYGYTYTNYDYEDMMEADEHLDVMMEIITKNSWF